MCRRHILANYTRGDGDGKLAVTQRFIGGKRDDLSPSRRQDGPVQPGFGCRFIGQKPSLGIRFGLGVLGHVGDRQGLEYIQIIVVMDDQGMTGLVGIVLTDVFFVLLIPGCLAIRFLLVFGAFLAPSCSPLPLFCGDVAPCQCVPSGSV